MSLGQKIKLFHTELSIRYRGIGELLLIEMCTFGTSVETSYSFVTNFFLYKITFQYLFRVSLLPYSFRLLKSFATGTGDGSGIFNE